MPMKRLFFLRDNILINIILSAISIQQHIIFVLGEGLFAFYVNEEIKDSSL